MAIIVLLAWSRHGSCQAAVLTASLYDVHSCSLLFDIELDELQHFIWSLEWIEWGNFRVKAPRVFISRPIILNCIKRRTVFYKSISPYGYLEMYLGYVFIERRIGWRHWLLRWGTCQCLPWTCNSPGHNKLKWSAVLAWWIMLRTCLLVSKCMEPCTQDFQCDTFANPKVGCRCMTASHSIRSQPAGNNILLVISYIAWKSTVPPSIGDIIMTWFVRSALCMKFTDMMKITVSFATTNDVLCLSLWYSRCIMIVLASTCFISRRLITTNLFISINIGSLPASTNMFHAMSSFWFTEMILMICSP